MYSTQHNSYVALVQTECVSDSNMHTRPNKCTHATMRLCNCFPKLGIPPFFKVEICSAKHSLA